MTEEGRCCYSLLVNGFLGNRGKAERRKRASLRAADLRAVAYVHLPVGFVFIEAVQDKLVRVRVAGVAVDGCFFTFCAAKGVTFRHELSVAVGQGYRLADGVSARCPEMHENGAAARAVTERQLNERIIRDVAVLHPLVIRGGTPASCHFHYFQTFTTPWQSGSALTPFISLRMAVRIQKRPRNRYHDHQKKTTAKYIPHPKTLDCAANFLFYSLFFFFSLVHAPILYRKMNTCNKKRLHSVKKW